jgi:hypothetical protein
MLSLEFKIPNSGKGLVMLFEHLLNIKIKQEHTHSQTCIKRSHVGERKSGLLIQTTS